MKMCTLDRYDWIILRFNKMSVSNGLEKLQGA